MPHGVLHVAQRDAGDEAALVLPPYLLWFKWWDRRLEQKALALFPDDAEEEQRLNWQFLRALEGPRLPRLWKLDLSDFYARRKGKKPS